MSTALRALLLLLLCAVVVPLAGPLHAAEPGNTLPAFDKSAVLQPQNRSTYHIFIDDKDGQTIDVYNHPSGVFIPIDPLLQKLGYEYQRDDNDKLLQVTFPDKTTLIIRFGKNEYIRNGETVTLQDSDYIYSGVDIYLNYDLINKTFPIGLSLDQANAKLHVVLKQCEPPQTKAAAPDDFPVPQAAPREPVIVDNIGSTTPPPPPMPAATPAVPEPVKTAEAAKPPAEQPTPTATPPPQKSKDDDEDNPNAEEPLVLQPKIKSSPPSDQFIEAIAVGDKLYLPLGDMVKMLEFDIKVDDAAGTGEGSFISPDHDFSLNTKAMTAQANHQSFALTADSIRTHNGQIYVNADDFKNWFGITCAYDHKFMTLAMNMDFTLPVEARNARHDTWKKLMLSQTQTEKNLTPYQTPYQLASDPFVDVNLNAGYNSSDTHHASGSYTVLGAGDLGYLTTDIYASGTDQSPLDNLRITAGRKDPNGELLGPMGATQFSVGDIDSPALNLVTNNNLGRGLSVSNRSLMAADNFDTHTITGNAVPGWEVELYRNNLLLGFQTVDNNGRYEFLNQPLIYGVNNFRVVLYGPQGQIEDHVESVMVGSSMLKPGQVEYTFSANQEAASMIQFDKINGSISTANQPQGLRMVGDTRVGVAKFLTLGMGAAQTELPDGYHRYATMLADTSFAGVFSEANFIMDMNNGFVGGVTAITSIDDVSIRMLHRQYHDFTSEVETLTAPDNFRKAVSEMDLNSQIYIPLLQDFNIGGSALYETYTNDVPHTTYTGTISKNVLGISFNNSLNYIIDSEKQLQGEFGMQTRFDNIMFRADGTYNIKPMFELHDAAFTAQYRIDKELSAQSQIDKGLDQDSHTTFTQTFNRDIDFYRLSLTTQVNRQMQYMVGVSMVFSLAHDDATDNWHTRAQSMANSGAIEPRVFVDNHYDGIYHDDDPIISDAGVRINGVPTQDGADKHFIAPVNAYQPVDVDVDISTIKDPMLSPATDGYRVSTRPGDVAKLDFPLIATSEIDGSVSIVDEKGQRYQIPDIVVEIQNADGKLLRRVMSESDGYYNFDKIKPGKYIITIPPEALAHYHAEISEPLHIKIDKATDFRTGNDIVLKATGPLPPNLQKWEK